MKLFKTFCLSLSLLSMTAGASRAGPVSMKQTETVAWDAFAKGNNEVEFLVGAFGGMAGKDTPKRPDYGFALAALRYGWMLNDPSGNGLLRGNWEFMVGAFGAPVLEGPGSYHVGADLTLRYNFVQPGATVVPFFQIFAGGGYSDVSDDDAVQDYLGTDWNWELGSSIGLRFMLSERMALTTAVEWRHFSNGGKSARNRSYNGLGGTVGLAWFY